MSPLVLLAMAGFARGAITVEGIADKTVYTDRVSFRIVAEAGSTYDATLNGQPVSAGVQVAVDEPEFYELIVKRLVGGVVVEGPTSVLFIVRASERVNTEWGLPPWTPYPSIPSASAEFSGARLAVVAPEAYPLGLEIPFIALVKDAVTGSRVGANGFVAIDGLAGGPVRLFRGVGSAILPAAAASGTLTLTASIGPLSTPKQIAIEASTSWQAVSGTIATATTWGPDARIHVTGDLTVPAGVTLTIGAGSVIEIGPGVDIAVNGTLDVQGRDRPVTFAPESSASPWGGISVIGSNARATMEGAILTGSGADPAWFTGTGRGYSHRQEQPAFYIKDSAHLDLTACYLVWNKGQGGHGEDSFIKLTGCLVQRATTFGQYNGGMVTLRDSAFVEFPAWDAPFVDGDNDAMYLSRVGTDCSSEGTPCLHSLTNCLIGWTGDDGIDAGGGGTGPIALTGCWFESTYHEANALSDNGLRTLRGNVYTNCGQGIECGYGNEDVDADGCLSTANLTGARFGDCYDWDYNGFLKVTNSLLLYNKRNIWGRTWADDVLPWQDRGSPTDLTYMDLHSNYLSAPDPLHPSNAVWDPGIPDHLSRLEGFLPAPDDIVGIGLAVRADPVDRSLLKKGAPVRLSTFTRKQVSVDYHVAGGGTPDGTLVFSPGETVKMIPIDAASLESSPLIRVTISDPVNAELTGLREVSSTRPIPPVTLVQTGSRWMYLDTGVSQGTAWRALDFPETGWKEGPAELGYGDKTDGRPEATEVSYGSDPNKKFPTTYFRKHFDVANPAAFKGLTVRLLRDDGGVVYINDREAFRSNMDDGIEITYDTLASGNTSSETAFFSKDIDPSYYLERGANIIAVEIHQNALNSSDISFDLELIAQPAVLPQGIFVRGEANGDGEVDISDPLRILFFLFAGAASDCEDALDVDDKDNLNISDVVYLLLYLFKDGEAPPSPFPAAGEDLTLDDLGCERL